jgi:hypothetical protein
LVTPFNGAAREIVRPFFVCTAFTERFEMGALARDAMFFRATFSGGSGMYVRRGFFEPEQLARAARLFFRLRVLRRVWPSVRQ